MPCQWAKSQFWKTVNARGRVEQEQKNRKLILLGRPYGEKQARPRKTLVSWAQI